MGWLVPGLAPWAKNLAPSGLAVNSHLGQTSSRMEWADYHFCGNGVLLLKRPALLSSLREGAGAPLSLDGENLTFRQLFRRQAERLARAFTAGEPYEPFRLPC
jgi:hypothetical protein